MRTVAEFRLRARKLLPAPVFDYYDGAAGVERTARANEAAFRDWWFVRRVLVEVAETRTVTSLLGRNATAPLLLAPTALHQLAHPEGELATAAGAIGTGLPIVVSTLSSTPLDEITKLGGDVWFQLYLHRDPTVTTELVRRAEQSGARVLVLTVDTPVPGRRLRDERRRFSPPRTVRPVNLEAATTRTAGPEDSSLAELFADNFHPGATWQDVGRLIASTALPVVIKGVGRAADARQAVELGAAAVIVSNHGGRQLDGERPTLHALPEITRELGPEAEVYLDGGVRTGGDILKALALGARAVLIGRPYLWGLAVGGEAGVAEVLRVLLDELELDMRLIGLPDTADASPELLTPARSDCSHFDLHTVRQERQQT